MLPTQHSAWSKHSRNVTVGAVNDNRNISTCLPNHMISHFSTIQISFSTRKWLWHRSDSLYCKSLIGLDFEWGFISFATEQYIHFCFLKTLLNYIMGNVGASVYGAWCIKGTKSQEMSASAALNCTILILNLL